MLDEARELANNGFEVCRRKEDSVECVHYVVPGQRRLVWREAVDGICDVLFVMILVEKERHVCGMLGRK
jgi:hypothetical protein